MGRRSYSGAAAATTLAVLMDTSVLSVTVAAFTDWPTGSGGPFAMTIDRGQATEEKVLVSSITGSVATLLQRAYDGTTAHSHTVGAVVEHTMTGIDADEANAHVNATGGTHGLGPTEGDFVGTVKTQTLTGKTIDGGSNTLQNIPRTASPELQADIAAEAAARAAADTARYTSAAVDALLAALIPPGTYLITAAVAAPAGYLVCDGAAVSRATYATLFGAIGTFYGAGDGSTTFNLPNFAGKAIRGAGGIYSVGATGGADSHAIAAGNLPAHAHDLAGHGHALTHDHGAVSTDAQGVHAHSATYLAQKAGTGSANSFVRTDGSTGTVGGNAGAVGGSHAHTVDLPSYTGLSGPPNVSSTGNGPGSGTALDTRDPFTVALICIKT